MKRTILFIAAIFTLCGCERETFITNVYAERTPIECDVQFIPVEYSDAVYDYENFGYRLVSDLYVSILGGRIILPTCAEYSGATVKIFNYKHPPDTRLPVNTLIVADGGFPISGAKNGIVSIQGEVATFIAIPDCSRSVKWVLINKHKC